MAPEWLYELIEQGIEAVAVFDQDLQIVYLNQALADLLGYAIADVEGANVLDFVHEEDLARAGANIEGMTDGADPPAGLLRLRRADGTWGEYELSPLRLDLPEPPAGPGPCTAVSIRDHALIDAHWAFLAALASGDEFHQCVEGLAHGLSDLVDGPLGISYEHETGRRFAGPLPPRLAGIVPREGSDVGKGYGTADTTPGTPWALALETGLATWCLAVNLPEPFRSEALALGLAVAVAVPVLDPGQPAPGLLVQWPPSEVMGEIVTHALSGRPQQAVAIALERRHAMQQLEDLVRRDPLTGLANRVHFFERLGELDGTGMPYGVCYVDLDRFKPVNDTFGHLVGDDILVACARRLKGASRSEDLVARLGGDEFALLCVGVGADVLAAIAARLVQALSKPVRVGGRMFDVGASVGAALSAPGTAPDLVVAAADAALYEAKRGGRGTWRLAGARVG